MSKKYPNRTKAWRKNAVKGLGRRMKQHQMGMARTFGAHPLVLALMQRAGIKVTVDMGEAINATK